MCAAAYLARTGSVIQYVLLLATTSYTLHRFTQTQVSGGFVAKHQGEDNLFRMNSSA